ncbi:MAG: organic solvent resistance ABC transporter ATP-binding protein [Acidobacteria bacterium]|nr:MAG: organic solvent resistance ABC transporter ATP-binding protein [Acidobacteriota bacterium]
MTEPILEMKNVVKYYGHTAVLNGISFSVFRGETKIIIGASGSGKSTILKLIMGLDKPDAGRIFVEGEDITKFNERQLVSVRQKIGMVFQESALFDSLTVRENVAYRLYELGVDEDEIDAKVRQSLGFVGLEEAIDKMPAELSGGMKRRVALARALIGEPEIMLYDEPTAGLDPVTSKKINELIITLRDIKSVTGVFVTHRMRDAFTLATEYASNGGRQISFHTEDNFVCIANTRFLMLRDGTIIFEGPDEVLRRSKDEYIKRFLA